MLDMYSWLCYAFLTLIPVFYWLLKRNHNYWSKRGINGPKPIPVFGTLLYQLFTRKSDLDVNWLKRYGKIYGTYEGNKPVLRVADPALLKQILVKDFHAFTNRDQASAPIRHPIIDRNMAILEGEDWKRVRSIVSPTFTSGKMQRMYPMIKECLNDLIQALDGYAMSGTDVDMKAMYGNYTLDVISTCAFATRVDPYKDPDNPFIVNAQRIFESSTRNVIYNFIVLLAPKAIQKFIDMTPIVSLPAVDFFVGFVRRLLIQRKNSEKTYNDFIDLMINMENNSSDGVVRDSNDAIDSHHVNEGEEELAIKPKTLSNVEKYMTEDEIIGQAFIFIVAGYETSASTLAHCTQELVLNPEIQERLYEEVMTAVDAKGDIDYEVLARLPYLDSVLSETLRLHSPAFDLRRIANEDYELGDTGITLYKGQSVEIPIFSIHYCEEFYPEPYQFNPDRFMPENRHKITPYTYLPFGSGPRNCIGMRLALLEAKLALAQLVRHYRIIQTPGTDVPVRLTRGIIVHSPARVIVGLVKRDLI